MTIVTDDNIRNVLTRIVSEYGSDSEEKFGTLLGTSEIASALRSVATSGREQFVRTVLSPIRRFTDFATERALPGRPEAQFILAHSRFVEWQFRSVIQTVEGSSCCADKTRTIVDALFGFYATDKRIEFDLSQKFTFGIPKEVFTTHEDIIEYFQGIYFLNSGQPEKFIAAYGKIRREHSAKFEQK